MALGRNLIITVLPFLGTVAAMVLTLMVILGGTKNSNVLRDIYFLKLDLSGITTSAISGLDGLDTTALDSTLRTLLSAVGISDFYTAALWGYCQGDINSTTNATTVEACSHPQSLWWLDIESIFNSTINNTAVSISLPTDLTDYNGTIETASKAMFVCYFISICVLAVALVAGCFSYRSRGAGCCAALITLVGLIASLLASGIATGLYIALRNIINNNTKSYGIVASVNHTMFGLTWGATAAALWAFVWWILTICCGSTRKAYEPEKQPFIGYVPQNSRY